MTFTARFTPPQMVQALALLAALTDPDNLPLTDSELRQFKRGRGRPFGSGKKEQVTLRLDAEILEQFRATGNGWQTRINEALRDWAKHH